MKSLKFPQKKPRVYLETTIPSYLVARPCRDIVRMANQEITAEWWRKERHAFELFSSELVLAEAVKGDVKAAKARLAAMADIPNLPLTPEAEVLASKIAKALKLPPRVAADAAHIALAAVNGMEFLLSWNCTHIVNAQLIPLAREVCLDNNYELPGICTPQELKEIKP